MEVKAQINKAKSESGAKLQIKRVARRLFAECGIHNVSVREIARATEQRNLGVVAYYFGTKEKLVQEILIDGAFRIEARRNLFLNEIEERGGPTDLSEVVEGIVIPSVRFADQDVDYGSFFNRFLLQISASDSALIDRTLEGRWNTEYQRCLSHMRTFLPHLTAQAQNRRFLLMANYIGSFLALREKMLSDTSHDHPTWHSEETLEDFILTTAAILLAPTRSKAR